MLRHRGRAVVFEDHADLHRRIDDESFPIDESFKQVGPGERRACPSEARRDPARADREEKLQPSDKRIATFFRNILVLGFFYDNYFSYL